MWILERAAVLARSRWAKAPKFWEKPSWWLSEEDIDKRREEAFWYHTLTDEQITNSTKQVIGLLENKINIFNQDNFWLICDENTTLALLEYSLDIFDKIKWGIKFKELPKFQKYIIWYALNNDFFSDDQLDSLETLWIYNDIDHVYWSEDIYELSNFLSRDLT
jgi:hypothetical protein